MKKPDNNIYLLYAFCDIVPLKSYKFWLKPFKVSYGNIGYLMKFNFVSLYCHNLKLSISRRRPLAYRNQSIDLQSKSMDWFLYDNGLRHGRVKLVKFFFFTWLSVPYVRKVTDSNRTTVKDKHWSRKELCNWLRSWSVPPFFDKTLTSNN